MDTFYNEVVRKLRKDKGIRGTKAYVASFVAIAAILAVAAIITIPKLRSSSVASVTVPNAQAVATSQQLQDKPENLSPTTNDESEAVANSETGEPADGTSTSSSANQSPTSPTNQQTPSPTAMPTMTNNCAMFIKQQTNNYNKLVGQQRSLLDSSVLSPLFAIGSMITSRYVSDYNKAVQSIFDKTIETTKAAGCILPIDKPALLPSTYPY